MIKSRFENLPNDKKQLILSSARTEFSQRPYDDASINKIMKNAGLSHGSFYTYFDNKEDLVHAMLTDSYSEMRQSIRDAILSANGDLFKIFPALFEVSVKFAADSEMPSCIHNIITGGQRDAILKNHFTMETRREFADWVKNQVNLTELSDYAAENSELLLEMLFEITRRSIAGALRSKGEQTEQRRRALKAQIEIIKHGAVKKEPINE